MPPIRVYTVSLGCPKNRVDTERLLGALGSDMSPAEDPSSADLLLVNTCGFIRPAVEESLRTILDLAASRPKRGRKPVLAVAGCLVSRYARDLVDGMPEVDLWLSTHELDLWPQRAARALKRAGFAGAERRRLSTAPGHAYLKISEGCSHDCRFCTIPSIRGPHTSRPLESLAEEARELLSQCVPELVVVGQDVTAYGRDLGMKDGLRRLLEALLPLKSLEWLRLMYLYPAGLTDSLLSFLAKAGPPLLPYLDVPLQHAHPAILKSMGRPFAKDPRLVLERIRKHLPDAVLRTSLIVGYPGETEEHFRVLRDFVAQARFQHLGVFAYQAEEGTPAAALPDQVADEVKEERRAEIMELQAGISAELLSEHVGETLPVLVEAPHPEWPGLYTGRAWFQAPEVDGATYVSAPPDSALTPGTIVPARIESAETYDLSALA